MEVKKRKIMSTNKSHKKSLTETASLLQNPAMAKRLLDAVVDVKKGKVSQHRLHDEK